MRYLILMVCLIAISPMSLSSHHAETPASLKTVNDGAILVVKNFVATEGKFEELGAFFGEILADTRAFEGCIKVEVFADESSKTYTLIEEWDSMADYDSYMRWRTQGGGVDTRGQGLIGGAKTYKWGAKTTL